MDSEEFKLFEHTLKQRLNVTFRLNSGEVNHQRVSEMLRDPDFITKFTDKDFEVEPDEHQSMKTAKIDYGALRMDCKSFYPNNVLFEMMIPRELLKKNLGLKQIHHLVIQLADCGLITR